MTGNPDTSATPTRFRAEQVHSVVASLLRSHGARSDDAELVAAELLRADQMGVTSHGVVRVGEYLDAIGAGRIDVQGDCTTVSELGAVAVVDGGRRFGQVTGRYALDQATRIAGEHGCAIVVVRNSHHIGRVGALAELGAERGLLVLALVAVGIPGPVAPLGGRAGRLGTNPFVYGVPTDDGPVSSDFATSAMPEGAINLARRSAQPVPDGVLIDATGTATTRAADLYADPPGAILPFGGPWAHRGYALNLMVELFAGTLAGYGPEDPTRPSNCMFLLAVDPAAALPDGGYPGLAAATVEFVRSAGAPGQVLVPGERELRSLAAAGDEVSLDPATVAALDARAAAAGLADRLIPSD